MRRVIGLFFLFALCSVDGFSWGHSQTGLSIQHWKTVRGTPVYFVHATDIPMVDIQIVFSAGSSQDRAQWGLASFTNALLKEGTVQHDADQIAQAFDDIGAQFDNEVNRDQAFVHLRTLSDLRYLKPALKTFIEMLTQPNFPVTAFNRVKQQILTAIQYGEQLPALVADRAFYQAIYGKHPYAHPPAGISKTVNALTLAEIQDFYKHYYTANNALVVIVGDLKFGQAKKIAESITNALPVGQGVLSLWEATPLKASTHFIPFFAKQNTIMMGGLGITPNDSDYFPLIVGNRILGGLPLSSILFDIVRNQHGYVYGISSHFLPLRYRGPFYIGLQTRTDQAKAAELLTQDILRQFLKAGPTVAQLKAAQKNIIGGFPLQISTNSDTLANVTDIAFYHRPLDFLKMYTAHVRAVTVEEVTSAMKKTIPLQYLSTVIVGERKKSEERALLKR